MGSLAHIGDLASSGSGTAVVVGVGLMYVLGLVLLHLKVKNGRLDRHGLRSLASVFAVLVVGVAVAPLPVTAQDTSEPSGLPDLISDPPTNWDTKNVTTPQGDVIRVIPFDGHLHNIGTGSLEITGNPQLEDGMKQVVFDGEEWTEVGTPTVRFETDDGHNHFHLMRAVEYALWTDDRSTQITDAAKVGFCLIDTQQMEEGFDANYLIDDFSYCGADQPDATELTMGITPGWRDTYDSQVTFQWVDISDVEPGRYWTSAKTDPNDEIVESNEDNNDIVFSSNRFMVDGYVARDLGPQVPGEIRLRSDAYGIVGQRAWVISEGPVKGTLDVPVGVDLLDVDVVRYVPNEGETGVDSFRYYAHDTTSPFPTTPTVVDVTIEIGDAPSDASAEPSTAAALEPAAIRDLGAQTVGLHEAVQIDMAADIDASADVQWYAHGLPAGLSIDRDTGEIRGTTTFAGDVESTVVATLASERFERPLGWTVVDQPFPSLAPTNDFSTHGRFLLRKLIGTATVGSTYRGSGLPDGASIVSNVPMVTGVARESGTFAVVVEELIDDVVVNTVEFEWTIAPAALPVFPL